MNTTVPTANSLQNMEGCFEGLPYFPSMKIWFTLKCRKKDRSPRLYSPLKMCTKPLRPLVRDMKKSLILNFCEWHILECLFKHSTCVAVSTAPARTGSKHKYIKIWDKKGINKTKYSQWGQRIAMFTKVVCFYNPSLLLLLMSKAKNLYMVRKQNIFNLVQRWLVL